MNFPTWTPFFSCLLKWSCFETICIAYIWNWCLDLNTDLYSWSGWSRAGTRWGIHSGTSRPCWCSGRSYRCRGSPHTRPHLKHTIGQCVLMDTRWTSLIHWHSPTGVPSILWVVPTVGHRALNVSETHTHPQWLLLQLNHIYVCVFVLTVLTGGADLTRVAPSLTRHGVAAAFAFSGVQWLRSQTASVLELSVTVIHTNIWQSQKKHTVFFLFSVKLIWSNVYCEDTIKLTRLQEIRDSQMIPSEIIIFQMILPKWLLTSGSS